MICKMFFFFHLQIGTPWADGTASISQCAINPGETFKYRFKVDRVITQIFFSFSIGFDLQLSMNEVQTSELDPSWKHTKFSSCKLQHILF